ncbi:phosphofructokinase [Lancefieldella parvula DSM 20469]|uniref:Pyrophosphate--fructose 6-phosphate 1-phosphotransferase n=1 Tax=Lancefieldella parvula (strain ATCC 33793 / DSM 20469 / CCUG 32760 / JCM 10300 / KCTC 3663 / VPI 0546 / 1246) TaxID=521095 RepID=C8W9K0_LANP1|nr:6-phosphofructokinase [Lancefieldella parvula]ACV50788.1 phosphofructokinase [Lancefieldella parvula DSM 20469]
MHSTSEHAIHTILVGQSGGPTTAINASLAGIIRAAHAQGLRVLGMRNGIQGFLEGNVVDLIEVLELEKPKLGALKQADTNLGEKNLQLLRKTPSSWLGSCRFKLPELEANSTSGASSESTANSKSAAVSPIYQQIDLQLKKYQVDAVLYIGGNDSMDTADKLSRYFAQVESAVRVVGVPKTIDNDLEGTDHTPGFGSAARFVASVTAELTRDGGVYNTKNVTFIEAMGRDAGWLTAAGALAQDICGTAPDFVLLPEVPLDVNALLSAIEQRLREKNNVIVVVSEGVHHADGSFLFDAKSVAIDTFGHLAAQSGTAQYLSQLVKDQLGVKSRGIELNTLQRCASHAASKVDLDEAEALGAAGVKAVLQGKTGVMVGVHRIPNEPYTTEIRTTPVADVANKVKLVPREMISEDGFNVTDTALTYLRPLVAGIEEPVSVDGLPRFLAELP